MKAKINWPTILIVWSIIVMTGIFGMNFLIENHAGIMEYSIAIWLMSILFYIAFPRKEDPGIPN